MLLNLSFWRKQEDAALAFSNSLIDGMQNASQSTLEAYEKLQKYIRKLKELKDQEDISPNNIKSGIEKDYFDDSDAGDFINKGLNPNEVKIIDADDIEVIDEYAASVDDLNKILIENGRITGMMSVAQTDAWLKATEQFESAKVNIEDISGSLISALESAATQGGNFLENAAKGVLSAIGSLLIKEGTAYIALGIARDAAFPGSGTKTWVTGGALVAAGIALKAGSSAIGKGGGSGGSNGRTGTSLGRAEAVQNVKSDTANNSSGLVAVAKVKGQDLILAIENAGYSRQGYLPT